MTYEVELDFDNGVTYLTMEERIIWEDDYNNAMADIYIKLDLLIFTMDAYGL